MCTPKSHHAAYTQDEAGYPRQGDDGCAWYETWLQNIIVSEARGTTLHVIQKQDQPRTYPDGSPSWTLGQPVGHAQALEIITLQQLGFEFVVHPTPAAFLEVRSHHS